MSRFRPDDNEPLSPPLPRPDVRSVTSSVATAPPFSPPVFPNSPFAAQPLQESQYGAAPAVNPMQNLAVLFALGSIFVSFSFAHEVIGITLGVRSFLPWVFGIPAFFGFLFFGGPAKLWSSNSARMFIAYSLWLLVAMFFSSWPGDSFEILRTYFETAFIPFLLVGGLVLTMRDFRRLLYTIAAAGIFNELTGKYLGSADDAGRFELQTQMTIGNSNDFAAHLMLILPMLWFTSRSKSVPMILRIACMVAMPYGLYLILRTGSRGALIGLAALYLCALLVMKGSQRLIAAVALPAIGMLVLLAIPSAVSSRLGTVFSSRYSVENEEAFESKVGRQYLFHRSLELTVQHPLLGVGPGEFGNVEGGEARAQGRRGTWAGTHNSYTQISSEAGIPALLLVLISFGIGLKNCLRVRREALRQENRELAWAAASLAIGVIGFCAAVFFLTMAYRFYFPVMAGMLTAISRMPQTGSVAASTPAPAPVFAARPRVR